MASVLKFPPQPALKVRAALDETPSAERMAAATQQLMATRDANILLLTVIEELKHLLKELSTSEASSTE